MDNETIIEDGVRPWQLWIGLLGGAIAWLVRFLLVYVIAEWGCVPPLPEVRMLGMTGTAWLLLLVSVAMFVAACAAAVLAHRSARTHRQDADDDRTTPGRFMARTGLLLSALFAFIILVETIPIFFFTSHC